MNDSHHLNTVQQFYFIFKWCHNTCIDIWNETKQVSDVIVMQISVFFLNWWSRSPIIVLWPHLEFQLVSDKHFRRQPMENNQHTEVLDKTKSILKKLGPGCLQLNINLLKYHYPNNIDQKCKHKKPIESHLCVFCSDTIRFCTNRMDCLWLSYMRTPRS